MPDNQNQNQPQNNGQEDMIFLPESPDTPSFGPPPGVEEPPAGIDMPTAPGEESGDMLPTPALPGAPDFPGAPVRPTLPVGPITPGNGQRPPVAIYPIPIIPRPEPDAPEQGYCTIRFLHGAVGFDALNIFIGNKPVVNRLQYGEVSSYFIETDEFKTINVVNPQGRRMLIASETFFFGEDDVYTIAFINGLNGLGMYLIPDIPCTLKRQRRSCIRAVNLSYNSPALDVTTQDGRVRFEDLRFKTISAYKQIQPGTQEFFVTEMLSGAAVFQLAHEIEERKMYTIYIIGDAYGAPDMTGIVTEDYSLLLD